MQSDEHVRSFGSLQRGTGLADKNGNVHVAGPFKTIHFNLIAPKPKRRRGGKRGHVKHSKNARKKKVAKALTKQHLAKWERDAQIREISQILEELAAEGRIEKCGPDTYRGNLASRMAHRRNLARATPEDVTNLKEYR